jgi:hypothetical protein
MKMSYVMRGLFVAVLLVTAPLTRGGEVAKVDVTVSNEAGKLVYRGTTDSNGVFATKQVAQGSYVIQFNAKRAALSRNDYAIYAAAGHRRAVADTISGAQLAGAGVAMRLKPAVSTPIIGQVALGGVNALGTKIVKGVRYVLLPPRTGDIGPRWVEEGTAPTHNVTRIGVDDPNMIKPPPAGMAH